ncbi:DUF1343 domain-containing protein [Winogradskyella sp.]|uniref:exo-beta-N-acetylmuramidase NamZ family protein n=1 Tax=Winogradskyella sp. TaxID=1883156 RepID=UPI0025F5BF23|nr:DUF1343 domain-containing protein [Winogradskyella sp.]
MRFNIFKNTVLIFVLITISCGSKTKNDVSSNDEILKQVQSDSTIVEDKTIVVGANRTELYLPLLKGKRVGIIANQTSVIFKEIDTFSTKSSKEESHKHLVDSLLLLKIDVKKVFAPEHGFRGTADAGEVVKDGIDTKTGLPIVSLYGKNKKPSIEQLNGIDIIVFDIQDVGARFYTYISSLHYVMEACAEQNIPILILDRPNPNGHYIDGPVLEPEHKSFVGMHPVPVVHGMTISEYAQMINGENWLKDGIKCELKIIPIKHYSHQKEYNLIIKPSPNLPNNKAINLYPSLCFFEGTNVSVGRGTNKQFQIVGSPFSIMPDIDIEFIPIPNEGAKNPKHEGKFCYGYKLDNYEKLNTINLSWLIKFYRANKQFAPNETYFKPFFTKLAGTKKLQQQIEAGMNSEGIRKSWQKDLVAFKKVRQNYLIYK